MEASTSTPEKSSIKFPSPLSATIEKTSAVPSNVPELVENDSYEEEEEEPVLEEEALVVLKNNPGMIGIMAQHFPVEFLYVNKQSFNIARKKIIAQTAENPVKLAKMDYPIFYACIRDDIDMIQTVFEYKQYEHFLKSGVEFTAVDNTLIQASFYESTKVLPLLIAAAYDSMDVFKHLMHKKITLTYFDKRSDDKDFYSHSLNYIIKFLIKGGHDGLAWDIVQRGTVLESPAPFVECIIRDNERMLTALLDRVKPSRRYIIEEVLYCAMEKKSIKFIDVVLPFVDLEDGGYTILKELILSDDNLEIVEHLLNHELIDVQTYSGEILMRSMTPKSRKIFDLFCKDEGFAFLLNWKKCLFEALKKGDQKEFENLMENPNIDPSQGGNLAIEEACRTKNLDAALALLRHRRFTFDGRCRSILPRFAENGWSDIIPVFLSMTNVSRRSFNQALEAACKRELRITTRVLLDSVNREIGDIAFAPFFYAIKNGDVATLTMLIRDNRAKVAMHENVLLDLTTYAKKNAVEMFKLLLTDRSVHECIISQNAALFSMENDIELSEIAIDNCMLATSASAFFISFRRGIFNNATDKFASVKRMSEADASEGELFDQTEKESEIAESILLARKEFDWNVTRNRSNNPFNRYVDNYLFGDE